MLDNKKRGCSLYPSVKPRTGEMSAPHKEGTYGHASVWCVDVQNACPTKALPRHWKAVT